MSHAIQGPVLVTGATGLVGSAFCHLLLAQNVPVVALVRDLQKAQNLLGVHPLLTLLPGDVTQPIVLPCPIRAIVHGANPTDSRQFVTDPVGVIHTCVEGTRNLLELARSHPVDCFLYLSSGEVYGQFDQFTCLTEQTMGPVDPMAVRSSYPEAKRLCESLCVAYHAQYQIPAVVARLGVIFGPVVTTQDNRLLSQFARCILAGEDLVLHSLGKTVRSYCYVEDAVQGLSCLLEKGRPGTAYNVANPGLTLSVLEIAQALCDAYPPTQLVVPQMDDSLAYGYLPELQLEMDCSRLLALGWQPQTGLLDGFAALYQSILIRSKEVPS